MGVSPMSLFRHVGEPPMLREDMSERSQPPPHLPLVAADCLRAAADVYLLASVPPPQNAKHVLEQLGPPPFRKTAFPMMGFLASMYEHVAAHVAGGETPSGGGGGGGGGG